MRLTTQVRHPPPLPSSVLILLHRLRRRSHFFRWRRWYPRSLPLSTGKRERGKNYSNFNAISLLARLHAANGKGRIYSRNPPFRKRERERLAVWCELNSNTTTFNFPNPRRRKKKKKRKNIPTLLFSLLPKSRSPPKKYNRFFRSVFQGDSEVCLIFFQSQRNSNFLCGIGSSPCIPAQQAVQFIFSYPEKIPLGQRKLLGAPIARTTCRDMPYSTW